MRVSAIEQTSPDGGDLRTRAPKKMVGTPGISERSGGEAKERTWIKGLLDLEKKGEWKGSRNRRLRKFQGFYRGRKKDEEQLPKKSVNLNKKKKPTEETKKD